MFAHNAGTFVLAPVGLRTSTYGKVEFGRFLRC